MGAKCVDHLPDHRSGAWPWDWPWGLGAAFGLTEGDLRVHIRVLRQRQHRVHRRRRGAAHPAAVVEDDLAVRKLGRALRHLLVARDAELLAVWLRVQRTLIEISAAAARGISSKNTVQNSNRENERDVSERRIEWSRGTPGAD